MLSWIGWVATVVFASSYLCRRPATLRRVQAAAAVLWVIYGALIQAAPVIVANLIVAGAALYSSFGSSFSAALPPTAPPKLAGE
jgi:uncharacterized protein with PQ loop repeat